jgi:hypothetical protein
MVTAKTGENQPAQDKSTNPAVRFLNIEAKWLVLLAIGVGTSMIASGILALARNVGMVLGIGITGAIFTTFLSLGNPKDPGIMIRAFDMGLRSACGLALLAAIITSLRGNDHPNIKKDSV